MFAMHIISFLSQLINYVSCEAVRFCSRAVWLFPALLMQMRMALIWDFHQWLCKESACRAIPVIC